MSCLTLAPVLSEELLGAVDVLTPLAVDVVALGDVPVEEV